MSTITKQLDKEFLNNYYKEMVNDVGEIFQLFLSETPNELNHLKEAAGANNHKVCAELLHKIAPSFYNVGLPSLTATAKALEASIHGGEVADISEKLHNFYNEVEDYMPAVEMESKRLEAYM
jgi:HPt (histidine-containing phosphotransfer) domain-containing protein